MVLFLYFGPMTQQQLRVEAGPGPRELAGALEPRALVQRAARPSREGLGAREKRGGA